MATKTITATYLSGYTLRSVYQILSITSTGYVEGPGLTIPSQSPNLVAVYNLGSVFNTGSVDAPTGVVTLEGTARITNGDGADTSVAVDAFNSAVYAPVGSQYARVINYGTLSSLGGADNKTAAVFLGGGEGSVRNGTSSDAAAFIVGGAGVDISGAASVENYGAISADRANIAVAFHDGGVFTNSGFAGGWVGLYSQGASATLTNHGIVLGGEGAGNELPGEGVYLEAGGYVLNDGRISGPTGLLLGGPVSTVNNQGRIVGDMSVGVQLEAGDTVVNGSQSDPTAQIAGHAVGISANYGGTINNFGVISSDATGYGPALAMRGISNAILTNGTPADRSALIEGYDGVGLDLTVRATNFGRIEGTGGYAANLSESSSLVNGSASDRYAAVVGALGVTLTSHSELTNFGTIDGTGGQAVDMDATSTLAVEPDSVFVGSIVGHLGVLDLAAGDGTLSFGRYEDVVVSGSMATTTFSDFGVIEIAPQASFALPAVQSLDELQRLIDDGAAVIGETLTSGGTVSVSGTLSGAGTLSLTGGEAVFASGASLTVAHVKVSGGSTLADVETTLDYAGIWDQSSGTLSVSAGGTMSFYEAGNVFAGTLTGAGSVGFAGGTDVFDAGSTLSVAKVTQSAGTVTIAGPILNYAGLWDQTGGTLSVSSGDKITFTGTGNVFSGTLAGAGTIAFTGGVDTLSGASLSATNATISGATVALVGAISLSDTLVATTPKIVIGAAGATLSGGGRLELTNASTNLVLGDSASATLTNDDVIFGAGDLGDGQMTLDNAAKGIIEGDDSVALILDTGANTIVSAGEIVAVTALTIDSPVDNTDLLLADGGTLTAEGAVTGAGHAEVEGAGTLMLKGAFNQNVTFASGSTGVVELEDAKGYTTGTITGFSTTGANALDLLDIPFVSGTTTATYTGTTTLGVLTVKEGANVAKITLEGNYTTSTFTVSASSAGGTKVVDPGGVSTPPYAAAPLLLPHPFIAAMAGFGARAPSAVAIDGALWSTTPPMLATPRAQTA